MPDVAPEAHQLLARQAREMLSIYQDNADLVEVGAYQRGSNPRLDQALMCLEDINGFCRQAATEVTPLPESLQRLKGVLSKVPAVGGVIPKGAGHA
jgi:flagellum-specific ATP synthase